jgi:hypothetical protein
MKREALVGVLTFRPITTLLNKHGGGVYKLALSKAIQDLVIGCLVFS